MNSTNDLILSIPPDMENKVAYFLSKCTGKEWSGPAWYSVKYDKSGFPEKVKLEYFHVLHLGTSGETDWDGNDLLKIYKPLIKHVSLLL